MGSADTCLPKLLDPEFLKKIFGEQEVPKAVLKNLAKDIDNLKSSLEKSGKIDEFPREVRKFIKEQRQLTENQMREKLSNLQKNKALFEHVTQAGFSDNPVEGFMSILDKTRKLANGGNDSISARSAARFQSFSDLTFGKLEKEGLSGFVADNSNGLETLRAMEALAWGKTPGGASKQAVRAAEILMEHHEMMYGERLNAGVPIPRRQGFYGSMYHNAVKVGAATLEDWVNKTLPLLDKEFTFKNMTPDKIQEFMKETYYAIKAGTYGEDKSIIESIDTSDMMSVGNNQNLNRQLAASRQLHFTDAEAFNTYSNDFGHTLSESIAKSIEVNSRKITLLEKFGTNPEAAFHASLDRVTNFYQKQGRMDLVEKMNAGRKGLVNLFEQETMINRQVGNKTLAQVGNIIRSIQSAAKLGAVPFRSAANLAGAVVNVRNATGKNLIEVTYDLVGEWVKALPAEYKNAAFASKLENALMDERAHFLERSTLGRIDGFANKTAQTLQKWGGAEAVNGAAEHAVSFHIQNTLAESAGTPWEKLRPEQKTFLLENGHKPSDWLALSKGVETAADGRKFLTAEGIQKISDADITQAIKDSSSKNKNVGAYRRDMELKFRAGLIQQSNVATTTAGSREASALNFGTTRGTYQGEFIRLFTQFKSFTLQGLNIQAKILNGSADAELLSNGVLKSRTTAGNYADLAGYYMGGTAIALAADAMVKTLNGKPLSSPKDSRTWLDAFGKSGAGGMQVDFLVGQWDKYSPVEALAGPTFGSALASGLKISSLMRDRMMDQKSPFTKEVEKEGAKLLRSHLPFQNVPLVSRAYNALQYQALGEMIDPGSNARHDSRVLRDQTKSEDR